MKKNIIPVTDLRKTNELTSLVRTNQPVFVTKNGYLDMVILSPELYDNTQTNLFVNTKKTNHYFKEILPQDDCLGLINVASCSPSVKVGNIAYNINQIKNCIDDAINQNISILLFPELSICGYTCGDLLIQSSLIKSTYKGIIELKKYSKGKDLLFFVGAPFEYNDDVYNCAYAIQNGKILAIIPKRFIPNYQEFYESRYFTGYEDTNIRVIFDEEEISFGNHILLQNDRYLDEIISCEICEDAWVTSSPSTEQALSGATIILNLSSSNETIGKDESRKILVQEASRKLGCAYIYASSSYEESTTDLLFSSDNIIAELGSIINRSKLFYPNLTTATIDIERIKNKRRTQGTYKSRLSESFDVIHYSAKRNIPVSLLNRNLSKFPFVFNDFSLETVDFERVLTMQGLGLARRLKAINCKNVVLGISGGLDSTLALIVCHKAFDLLSLDKKGIIGITLPCFGTSSRTYNNAYKLSKALGTTLIEINIAESVNQHLKDIDHINHNYDVTFENAQARERTKVLMDYANKVNGLVIGTGDLSEIALGWCTYNGDHMSMYAVNASLPKTLIQAICSSFGSKNEALKEVLLDIVDTPISPELVPGTEDKIVQKTEDIVGPYELHDFFIYHYMNEMYSFRKIYQLAKYVFKNKYSNQVIKKWLVTFIKRFFTSQFKRSCMPDGIKVTSVSMSPRGDLRMPSDASYMTFIDEINELE